MNAADNVISCSDGSKRLTVDTVELVVSML